MRRLDRYILAEILGPLALGFLVYTAILMMQALFKSAELIIRSGVDFSTVGRLLALSMPWIVVMTIPMSLLFGILIAIGRLSADSELVADVTVEGTDLQAVRYNDWKAHFTIQEKGWAGPKEELNAPLLFNLRRDPYEKAAEESGMYVRWMGNKMWAFGPAARLVQAHLATFADFPPRGAAVTNEAHVQEQVSTEGGMSQ